MGYKDITVIPLDQADLLDFKWVKTLQEVSGRNDLFIYSKFVKAVFFFLKKAKLLNDIQTAEGIFRAYERNQGDTTVLIKNLLNKLDQANTLLELRKFKSVIKQDFNNLDIDKTRNPLRVGVSGEIHISLEPYVNLDIRRKLGEMNIEVHQSLSLYDWVVHKFHLNYHDGFIHQYPFLCMPEVTARTIITNKLKGIYDLPVIYFSFDEQSGLAGFRTRLEAFSDLMYGRRNKEIENNAKFIANGNKKIYPHYGNLFYNECVQLIQNSV
jgi:predicted nucleotide-binding protein (sugar kinase/HSP70/actin superfamily)